MCKAAWLSQNKETTWGCEILKSLKIDSNHIISQTTTAIALYSASADDLDIVVCFLDFQDINDSPKKMQYPVTDFLVSGHEA